MTSPKTLAATAGRRLPVALVPGPRPRGRHGPRWVAPGRALRRLPAGQARLVAVAGDGGGGGRWWRWRGGGAHDLRPADSREPDRWHVGK